MTEGCEIEVLAPWITLGTVEWTQHNRIKVSENTGSKTDIQNLNPWHQYAGYLTASVREMSLSIIHHAEVSPGSLYWLMPVTGGESIAVTRRGDDSMNRRQDCDWSSGVWGTKHLAGFPTQSFCLLQQLGEDKYFSLSVVLLGPVSFSLSFYLPPARSSLTFRFSRALLLMPRFKSKQDGK